MKIKKPPPKQAKGGNTKGQDNGIIAYGILHYMRGTDSIYSHRCGLDRRLQGRLLISGTTGNG